MRENSRGPGSLMTELLFKKSAQPRARCVLDAGRGVAEKPRACASLRVAERDERMISRSDRSSGLFARYR